MLLQNASNSFSIMLNNSAFPELNNSAFREFIVI